MAICAAYILHIKRAPIQRPNPKNKGIIHPNIIECVVLLGSGVNLPTDDNDSSANWSGVQLKLEDEKDKKDLLTV